MNTAPTTCEHGVDEQDYCGECEVEANEKHNRAKQKADFAEQLFNELSREIYYGVNMRFVLYNMPKEQQEAIVEFINKCRVARHKAPVTFAWPEEAQA